MVRSLRTLEGHTGYVKSIAFSLDGATIASGSNDKTIKLWDSKDGRLIKTLEGHTDCVNSIAFSPDIASGSNDKTMKLWDSKDGRLIKNS